MRIFLDDERLPIDDGKPWTIVRSISAFFKTIAEANAAGDPVTVISFDHDLGAGGEASRAIKKMLQMQQSEPGVHFPKLKLVIIHTANAVQLKSMTNTFMAAAEEGLFPHLVVQTKSALFTRYPIDETIFSADDYDDEDEDDGSVCDDCELPIDICACEEAAAYDALFSE